MPSSHQPKGLFARILSSSSRRRAWRPAEAAVQLTGGFPSEAATIPSHTSRNAVLHLPVGSLVPAPSLATLLPGDSGSILRFVASNERRLHLMEMGLTPGTSVKVLRTAAFGGPLDIVVRGYRLSLRRDEAESILMVKDAHHLEGHTPSFPADKQPVNHLVPTKKEGTRNR